MPNENTYRDCSCKSGEIPHNADYVHNSSTTPHCCDNDKCECHHPLRLWSIKYEVVGVSKFLGVAVVQAKDLCNAQYIFIQNSKFNGFREYIHILCIEELYPNPEPVLLLEDSAAIIDRHNLKSYPFLLKSDYEHNIQNISDNVIEAVEDYIKHNPFQQVQSNWNETDETSKAYILNKPEIPDAQVQADWNETNESSKAFIQNKPTIPEAQVNADWNSESGKSQILNKPTDLVRKSDIEGLLKNDGTVYTGKYLEQVEDLDNFQASEGKIVQYIGETNSKYTNGFNYKKVGTQIVIPAGTKYINIQDASGRLATMGIPNGIYYKATNQDDAIKDKIRYSVFVKDNKSYTLSDCVPITHNGSTWLPIVGLHGWANSEFSKIVSYNYYPNEYWNAKFENGVYVAWNRSSREEFDSGGISDFQIYENLNGIKIYVQIDYINHIEYVCVLPIEYAEELDTYQVITPLRAFQYKTNTTQSPETIGVDEWQQCIPPEEDTSHYVVDSEIGWIEH
jgi:hypothetical protein